MHLHTIKRGYLFIEGQPLFAFHSNAAANSYCTVRICQCCCVTILVCNHLVTKHHHQPHHTFREVRYSKYYIVYMFQDIRFWRVCVSHYTGALHDQLRYMTKNHASPVKYHKMRNWWLFEAAAAAWNDLDKSKSAEVNNINLTWSFTPG